jgi:hypothetical protein
VTHVPDVRRGFLNLRDGVIHVGASVLTLVDDFCNARRHVFNVERDIVNLSAEM